ncbi:MAG TPA: hypothetical protein VMS43_03345 [Allosphingosinicella sp.]|nr:hypothetical protein [Allosphingosinicella sp.]
MYSATLTVNRGGTPFLATEVRLLFLLTFAICVVIPHSAQTVTGALILLTGLLSLLAMRGGEKLTYIGICYLLGAMVTCFYLAIGLANGAPTEAIVQTIITYLISPLLWIVILRAALQVVGIEQLVRYMIVLAWLVCASVAIFFYLYLTRGAAAVAFLTENANIYLGRGFSGATMHVYGTLIFLVGAFLAAPEVIKSKLNRILLLGALAVAALTSGRSALIFAIPAGLLVGLVVRQLGRRGMADGSRPRAGMGLRYAIIILTGAVLVAILDYFIADVDVLVILQSAWEKLTGGGGEARIDQTVSLWQGIRDTYGLGAGHGVGVSIERNSEFAWRYENVPLAVLYRAGILGAAIYALPFVIYFMRAGKSVLAGVMTNYDRFMFAGLVAVALAGWTNPYLESFIFQWMFILPLVSFDVDQRRIAQGRGPVPRTSQAQAPELS